MNVAEASFNNSVKLYSSMVVKFILYCFVLFPWEATLVRSPVMKDFLPVYGEEFRELLIYSKNVDLQSE